MALSPHGCSGWISRIATVGRKLGAVVPTSTHSGYVSHFRFCLHIPAGAAGVYP